MIRSLSELPRSRKILILMMVDLLMLYFSIWLGFYIRLGEPFDPRFLNNMLVLSAAPLLTLPAFHVVGVYKAVIRFLAPRFVYTILKGAAIAALILVAVAMLGLAKDMPRSVYILYFILVAVTTGSVRMLANQILPMPGTQANIHKTKILVYGAGSGGIQIAKALLMSREYKPLGFIDEKADLHHMEVLGLRVYPPEKLAELVDFLEVEEIILAIPSLSRQRKREVIAAMETLPVAVKSVPGISDLIASEIRLEDLREVDIEDLLGRDPIPPYASLLRANIEGQSVLVTGAGGSIGSELCRQIFSLKPKRLILFECNEFVLYSIEQELRMGAHSELIPIMGSILNQEKMERLLRKYKVETIYHAAAYKHVPLVEANICEGVFNNVFGTARLAQAAINTGVNTFILISSDKAVRPTSVMGASKRLAELVLQGWNHNQPQTRFAMVRFGNVLGSSGSVVPLFRKQIKHGGPVTVTDPEMTRYFMTIKEAAQLVIQAGALAGGGDVFVLDMGEPVKILDMAKQMIRLSGLTIKSEVQDGDIEIKITGLRPGEKLYEELLIGDNTFSTDHPRIMGAREDYMNWNDLNAVLAQLQALIDVGNEQAVKELLMETIQLKARVSSKHSTVSDFLLSPILADH